MSNVLERVELFAVGLWNGMEFTVEDLKGISNAFHVLGDNHKVPLKFGHNEEQPMTDGQPAIGRVTDVRVEGNLLVGSFADVPDIVFDAINANLYSKVSIELDMGVEWKEQFFTWVLSGVALLGADIPAVNTLSDLSAFMIRSDDLVATSHFAFSRNVKPEDKTMATELEIKLQLEVDALKTANSELGTQVTTLNTDKAKFTAENDTLKATAEKRDGADRTVKFATAKAAMTADLDGLVKSKHILPAQRDDVLAGFKEDDATLAGLQFTVDTLKKGAPTNKLPTNGGTGNNDDGEDGMSPSAIVADRTRDFMAKHNVSFAVANQRVLETDPDLARQYIDSNGSKEG